MVGQSSSQIIPILIGEEKLAVKISNELLTKGIFAQAVRYPTVKKGSARLRISLSSLHRKTQLIYTIDCLEKFAIKVTVKALPFTFFAFIFSLS
jgi:7-keto-8-aminopelargonate synthetase-like enzyme